MTIGLQEQIWAGDYWDGNDKDGALTIAYLYYMPKIQRGDYNAAVALASVYYSAAGNAFAMMKRTRRMQIFLRLKWFFRGVFAFLDADMWAEDATRHMRLSADQVDVVSTIFVRMPLPWKRRKALRLAREIMDDDDEGVSPHTRALLATTIGTLIGDTSWFDHARNLLPEIAIPRQKARVLRRLAEFEKRRGDSDASKWLFAEARVLAEESGAKDQILKIGT